MASSSPGAGTHGMSVVNEQTLRGPEELINGWHSSSPVLTPPTTALDIRSERHAKGESKAGGEIGYRTPRRLAASRAMEQVMTSQSPADAAQNILHEPSSSRYTLSPIPAPLATPSSSPMRHSSLERTNLRDRRGKSSSSPFPPHGNPPSSCSPPGRAEQDEGRDTSLDAVEQNQFHFRAEPSAKTDILRRPPPKLPYDTTYLPLSPNGIDQIGHVLAPPAPNGAPSAAKGGLGDGKQGRGHHGAAKKVLRGQDMEEHIVSQLPGQRAMPWGLKSTLIEQQAPGRRAKTRMGTLKRTQ